MYEAEPPNHRSQLPGWERGMYEAEPPNHRSQLPGWERGKVPDKS